MRVYFVVLLLLLSSFGCAGITAACGEFDNRSPISDSVLLQAWSAAQEYLARQGVQLNAVAVQSRGETPVLSKPEPDAANVHPCGLRIKSPPEAPAHELNSLPSCRHCPYSNPTGVLRCGSPTGYCAGYTDYETVYLPASNPAAAQWEFMVVILHRLGYRTAGM